jgi:hypothetical protein
MGCINMVQGARYGAWQATAQLRAGNGAARLELLDELPVVNPGDDNSTVSAPVRTASANA